MNRHSEPGFKSEGQSIYTQICSAKRRAFLRQSKNMNFELLSFLFLEKFLNTNGKLTTLQKKILPKVIQCPRIK
jgi:hypothetical protein